MVAGAPKSASLLAACPLARPALGGCAWCGQPLPPRRRTWCSDRCGTSFWKNHWWTLARRAAKRRDKYRCTRCGHALPKRGCTRAQRKSGRLEVNHREPCRGAHARLSCAHHLENLETLCVPCHQEHTSAIRVARVTRAG
ncbi:MAG TPA: hypothetical protein VIG32_07860 [Candidatus Baltobacteraceae bacterium]|jgi:hypothetical protein